MSTNPIIPYTFVPGTKAKAEEVNANFISVADSIQSNNDYINQKVEEINSTLDITSASNEAKFAEIETALEGKAEKDWSNIEALASSSVKGLTWFGTATSNVSATRPAVIVTSYLSGSTWYRLYSDKWVEQGGIVQASNTVDTDVTITFPKAFANTNYGFAYSSMVNTDNATTYYTRFDVGAYITAASTSMRIKVRSTYKRVLWYACGFSK